MAPDFWSDNRKAQAQMQQLNSLREEVTTWEGIATQLNDLHGLAELLEEEPDEEMQAEVEQSLQSIQEQIEKLQFALMLSGEHDERAGEDLDEHLRPHEPTAEQHGPDGTHDDLHVCCGGCSGGGKTDACDRELRPRERHGL